MANTQYKTKEDVLKRAEELVKAQKTFGELDSTGKISATNKGNLGQIIELNWYGYKPNNDSEPDFYEAGVELKVSPYKKIKNGKDVSAKERLVCNIINYVDEESKTFLTSSFWHKCKCMCLLSYYHDTNKNKSDMYVDHAVLIDGYSKEDLEILRSDYEIIVNKIKNGEAHLLSEGDTKYLGACTKGADSNVMRVQPRSNILAKQRAFSLKTTYMTILLRRYIFGNESNEHIVKDWRILQKQTLEEYVVSQFEDYYGMSVKELMKVLGIDSEPKQLGSMIARKILNVKEKVEDTEEFSAANIHIKTIKIDKKGRPYEAMSFAPFDFDELIEQKESFEDSDAYQEIVGSKILAVIFQGTKNNPVLKEVKFWTMPVIDVDELERVWNKTINTVENGVIFTRTPNRVLNNLPKSSESQVAHVRNHASKSYYRLDDGTMIGDNKSYGSELPLYPYQKTKERQWMTKQSFWLNKEYVKEKIVEN